VSHLNCYISGFTGQQGPAGFTGATGAKGANGRRRRRQAGCPGKRNATVPVDEGRITPFSAFCTAIHSFVTGEPRDFNFYTLTYHSKSHPADEKSSLKGTWSGSAECPICPDKRNATVPVAEGRITDCCVLCNKVENGDRRQFVGMPLYYSFVVGPGPTSNTVLRVPRVHNPNENAGWLLCGTEFCEDFTPKDIERCICIGVNPS